METRINIPINRAAAVATTSALLAGAVGVLVSSEDVTRHAPHRDGSRVSTASGRSGPLETASGAPTDPSSLESELGGPTPSTSSERRVAAATPHRIIITMPSYEGGRPPSVTPPGYEGGEPPAVQRDDNSVTVTFGRSGTFVPPSVDRGESGTFTPATVTYE
jgi:hypothetical protein